MREKKKKLVPIAARLSLRPESCGELPPVERTDFLGVWICDAVGLGTFYRRKRRTCSVVALCVPNLREESGGGRGGRRPKPGDCSNDAEMSFGPSSKKPPGNLENKVPVCLDSFIWLAPQMTAAAFACCALNLSALVRGISLRFCFVP